LFDFFLYFAKNKLLPSGCLFEWLKSFLWLLPSAARAAGLPIIIGFTAFLSECLAANGFGSFSF
jgi:hypothetical protein